VAKFTMSVKCGDTVKSSPVSPSPQLQSQESKSFGLKPESSASGVRV